MQNPVPKEQMASWYKCNSVNFSAEQQTCQKYTVKPGDDLYAISQNTGTVVAVSASLQ